MGSGRSKPKQPPPAATPEKAGAKGAAKAQESSPEKKTPAGKAKGADAAAGDPGVALFLEAYKAAPGDGWNQAETGESVSVLTNQRNTLPFATTCVRCEFRCHVSAGEVVKFLSSLDSRHERDFFYKSGKLISTSGDTTTFAAVMKTLNPREEVAVTVAQTRKEDEKGNWTLLETPVAGDAAVFMFPSFFVRNNGGDTTVVALYRFDLRKAWKDKAGEAEGAVLKNVHKRFHDMVANAMCTNLMCIGTVPLLDSPLDSPAPKPAPARQPEPPPAPGGGAPVTPVKQSPLKPNPAAMPRTPEGGNREGEGLGELIEGTRYRWKKGELIGHGAIGKVYMGLNFETGEMMAVKIVDMGQQLGAEAQDELKSMEQEIQIFEMITHPNLVRYYGMEKTDLQVCIFLEFVSGGSIATMLRKFGAFSEKMIANFTGQIVDGLGYLHSQSICHRDIKAANILYSNEGVVKLADFGTAKKLSDVMNLTTGLKSLVGTPYMMAPEVIRQTGHGMPADVWSLACVIWEMATTKPPFTQYPDRIVAMYNIAHAKNAPEPPESLTEAAKDFVRKCMTIDARGRATVEQLREHPFIATATKTIAPASPGQSSAPPYAQLPQVPSKPPPEDENSDRIIASIAEDDENAITSPTPAERNRRTSSDGKMRSGGVPSRARSSDKDPPARARERSPPLEERPSSKEKSRKDAGRGKGGRRDFSPSPDPMDSPPMTTPQRRSDYDPSPSLHPETDFLERGGHSTDDSNSLDSPVRDVPIIWGGEHPAHISLSSPSDSEDSEGESRYKASAKGKAVAGHRSTRAAKKAAGAADDNLVNQDGFTRDECAAIGKKFVAAKPKRAGAARSWDRGEERSDSESDPDLSDDPGGRVSSRNGIKAAAASRPAPKPKFSTTGMGDELSSDSEED